KFKPLPNYIQGEFRTMLEAMISQDYKKRPTVKALLESETMQLVGMIEKSKEQKGSEQENEQMNKKVNELEMKVRSLEVEKENEKKRTDLAEQEKQKAQTEKEKEKQEKEIALTEKDKEKQEKDKALAEIDKLKQKVNITEQEKQKAQSELDKQKAQTNESQELVIVFQQQVETAQSEVTRLTSEVQLLTAELSQLRTIPTSPKEQSTTEPNDQLTQQSVPPSFNPNMLVGIIPDSLHAIQQGCKIIHTDQSGESTVAFNPVISRGIVRFEGIFQNHSNWVFGIGIASASAVFGSGEGPSKGEIKKKTVCYWRDGGLGHIGDYIPGNSWIKQNKTVSCEVNMNVTPLYFQPLWGRDRQPSCLCVSRLPQPIVKFIQQLVAAVKELRMAVTAVHITYDGHECVSSRSDAGFVDGCKCAFLQTHPGIQSTCSKLGPILQTKLVK
ncbi:MAG: hypothetical protein EZS28_008283, partial [Streblomastix strix]